jgi:crotonobetainyl-CoA:carnitine CoA-transferase CaiB-like acyl-CoA transferase
MRVGSEAFHALLNQGKAHVSLDLTDPNDRQALSSLISDADIVIEAARPRALAQLGIDAARLVRTTPGLVWITITGHGAQGDAANWVGFGDDCGVRAGLSAALRDACGHTGFVGDAIADPLTGIFAARAAWEAWGLGRGGRLGLSLSSVVASCMKEALERDADEFQASLRAWAGAAGQPFPTVRQRPIGPVAAPEPFESGRLFRS